MRVQSRTCYSLVVIPWVGLRNDNRAPLRLRLPCPCGVIAAWTTKLCGVRSAVLGGIDQMRVRDADEMVFIDPS